MSLLPFLSVVIPCRNEEGFIATCLDSVIAACYPRHRLEILVVDGGSTDATRSILEDYRRRTPHLSVLDNPERRTPCGLNIGIRQSRGDVILRMDAHAQIPQDYLSQCVTSLVDYGADNVGGIIRTIPQTKGLVAEGIIHCLSHRFGVGNSAFRTGLEKPAVVDTVFGGCYRRDVFARIGLFNERLARSQDIELNLRLKHSGGRTVLVPSIVSDYYARSEYWPFVRHNFGNGMWSVLPFLYSSVIPVSARHLVPLAFVCALLVSALLALLIPAVGWWLLAIVAGAYLAVNLGASIRSAWQLKKWSSVLLLPLLFATLHLSYGFGSLCGLAKILSELVKGRWNANRMDDFFYEKSF